MLILSHCFWKNFFDFLCPRPAIKYVNLSYYTNALSGMHDTLYINIYNGRVADSCLARPCSELDIILDVVGTDMNRCPSPAPRAGPGVEQRPLAAVPPEDRVTQSGYWDTCVLPSSPHTTPWRVNTGEDMLLVNNGAEEGRRGDWDPVLSIQCH